MNLLDGVLVDPDSDNLLKGKTRRSILISWLDCCLNPLNASLLMVFTNQSMDEHTTKISEVSLIIWERTPDNLSRKILQSTNHHIIVNK